MRMGRLFTANDLPCSRCWVIWRSKLEVVAGLITLKQGVLILVQVAVSERAGGAGQEGLRKAEVRGPVGGDQGAGPGGDGILLGRGLMAEEHRALKYRIVAQRSVIEEGQGRHSAAVGSAPRLSRTLVVPNGAGERRGRGGKAVDRTRNRSDTVDVTRGLGAEQIGVGQIETVALDFDVDIVFERQSDGVLQRQVQVPGAHQPVQAAGIGVIDRRDVAPLVRLRKPRIPVRCGRRLQSRGEGSRAGYEILLCRRRPGRAQPATHTSRQSETESVS